MVAGAKRPIMNCNLAKYAGSDTNARDGRGEITLVIWNLPANLYAV